MREVHGVMALLDESRRDHAMARLKQSALFFDKIHIFGLHDVVELLEVYDLAGKRSALRSIVPDISTQEIDFLLARKFLIPVGRENEAEILTGKPQNRFERLITTKIFAAVAGSHLPVRSLLVRKYAARLQERNVNAIPIFGARQDWDQVESFRGEKTSSITVLSVAVALLPVPGEQATWEEIFDFKTELHDKLWSFRRFLKTLTAKQQKEAEIRDDIEWSLNEYGKAMSLRGIKASTSFVDVFLITPLEIIENLIKFNWSKIAKGAIQVQKREVELLEAEVKAPGRECAYVFDARRRFER